MTKEQKKRADEIQREIKSVEDNLEKLGYQETRIDGIYITNNYGGGKIVLSPDIALAVIFTVRGHEESRLKKLEAEFAAL